MWSALEHQAAVMTGITDCQQQNQPQPKQTQGYF